MASWLKRVGPALVAGPSRGARDIRDGLPTSGSPTKWLPILVLGFASVLHAEPTFYAARVAPIFDKHCTTCHGAETTKAGLRLDSFGATLKGGESGAVVAAGDVKKSELFRRITLKHDDEEFMPSEGKPPLSADEIKIIELWIADGASPTKTLGDFPGAPVPPRPKPVAPPATGDWSPRAAEIAALEQTLGVRLVPRSHVATDGLILRTVTAPAKCDDTTLGKLAPVAEFIVEAELARTKVTDAGLAALAKCANLRAIDLTRTAVTTKGVAALAPLAKLEKLNLTDTQIDATATEAVKALPALRQVWWFGTPVADGPRS